MSTTTTTATPDDDGLNRGDAGAIRLREEAIQEQVKERGRVLREALHTLNTYKEQADAFGRLVDVLDISSFDGNGPFNLDAIFSEGIGQSRAFIYPGATAAVYINETELKQLRALSRAFAIRNPYWRGIEHNRSTYTVGSGHTYSVTARKRGDARATPDLTDSVLKEIEDFRKANRYSRKQKERLRRLDRDGEMFLRLFRDDDSGVLQVRFVEPLLVATPPGKSQQDDVWFGIQFKGDYEKPEGYYIRPANYLGTTADQQKWQEMVPAADIQRSTVNVDGSSPRGLPSTFFVIQRCRQAVKTLSNMGALVEFRAKIALIRKHVNATANEVKKLLNTESGVKKAERPGTIDTYPRAAILDTNDQTTYEFPTAQTDVEKIVASIQAELRAAAASLGLAEYMVSADASNANFASTMVAEGPVVKTFETLQAELIEDDIEVLEEAIKVAIDKGRLPDDTLDILKINAEPPVIVSRNRLEETQADEILGRNKVMSRKTWAARAGLNGDEEQEEIGQERDEDAAYGLDDLNGGNTQGDTGLPTSLKPDNAKDWLTPTAEQVFLRDGYGNKVILDRRSGMLKRIKEDAATPMLSVPDIRQPNHYACGAASAMAVGKYFGVGPATIDEWMKALGTTVEKSTSPQAIIAYLQSLGLTVYSQSGMTTEQLAACVERGMPVICPGQYYMDERDPKAQWQYGHWQTVVGIFPGLVMVQDSSLQNLEGEPGGDVPKSQEHPEASGAAPGRKPIYADDWMARWHDLGEDGTKYVRYGIVVGPKQS